MPKVAIVERFNSIGKGLNRLPQNVKRRILKVGLEGCIPASSQQSLILPFNSHLLPRFTTYRISGEKLIKYQANSSCVITSVILMTTLFYKLALILQGEIWCRSLLRLCYTRWFATTIFSATQHCNVGTMLQPFKTMSQQYCIAVLRWKSSSQMVSCNITFGA